LTIGVSSPIADIEGNVAKSPGAKGSKRVVGMRRLIERRFCFGANNIPRALRAFAAPGERRDRLLGGKYALPKLDRDSRAGDCNVDDDCRGSGIR
jgi:hypothetical protein